MPRKHPGRLGLLEIKVSPEKRLRREIRQEDLQHEKRDELVFNKKKSFAKRKKRKTQRRRRKGANCSCRKHHRSIKLKMERGRGRKRGGIVF